MLQKRLTTILYGSDRNLWQGGPLSLQVSDIFAPRGPRRLYEGEVSESTVELRLDLPFDADQMYGVTFSAPHHRPAWRFIRRQDFIGTIDRVEHDELILRLMLVPDVPGTTDLANALTRLQDSASPFAATGSGIGKTKFEGFDVATKMAFLNIEAKLR